MKHNVKAENLTRRAKRTRMRIRDNQVKNNDLIRLCVHRTNQHIYIQAIVYDASINQMKVIATASTLEKDVKAMNDNKTGNIAAAKIVGKIISERLLKLKLPNAKFSFDRSGYKYHGRVKAIADAAREGGLEF